MNINKIHVALISIVFFIIAYFTSSSTIEIVSAVSGLLCVWLAAKENIWNYPIGFVNIICFLFIFYDAKLYADFTLQIVFLILGIYGWIYWLRNRQGRPVRPTTTLNYLVWLNILIATVLITLGWGYVLTIFTDASIPYADAFIATLSIIAQVLMSRKVLQNWVLWIIVDVLSVGMYYYKDLHLIAVLYLVFLVNAVYGYISWKKEMEEVANV